MEKVERQSRLVKIVCNLLAANSRGHPDLNTLKRIPIGPDIITHAKRQESSLLRKVVTTLSQVGFNQRRTPTYT